MVKKLKIAIIGAGVAGLASAALLARQGHQIDLYEQATALRHLGAGIVLWPNCFTALNAVLGNHKLEANPLKTIQINNLPPTSLAQQFQIAGTAPPLAVLRQQLMQVLSKRATHANISMQLGQPITPAKVEQLSKHYDLVLGCDGRMNSAARNWVLAKQGQRLQPTYQGFVNVMGISELATQAETIKEWRQPNLRLGCVPVSPSQVYWAAAWPSANNHALKFGQEQLVSQLAPLQHTKPPAQALIKGLKPNSLKTIYVHDLDALKCWHHENVVLVGDAAHAPLPTSGQGACQALLDAHFISQHLHSTQNPRSLGDALYRTRNQETQKFQQLGRDLADKLLPQRAKFIA